MNEHLPERFQLTIERKAALHLFEQIDLNPKLTGIVSILVYRTSGHNRQPSTDDAVPSVSIWDSQASAEITLKDIPLILGSIPLIGKFAAIYQTKLSKEPL